MTDRICELTKIINENAKTHEDAYDKKCNAEKELEALLKIKCEAYGKICNDIEMHKERNSHFCCLGSYDYLTMSGLETARGYLKKWLITEYCKE